MKGFTLVEMLAALFVFGLLSAAGATVMGSTLQNQTAVRERTDRLGDFQRLRAALKADLAQAADRRTRDAAGRPAPGAMSGGDLGAGRPFLTLTRRGWENRDADPRASLQYVEYALADGRLERRARQALDGAELGSPQVLAEGVESLRVAFLSRGEWTPVWAGTPQTQLPQAVRIDLTLKGVGRIDQLFLTPGEFR